MPTPSKTDKIMLGAVGLVVLLLALFMAEDNLRHGVSGAFEWRATIRLILISLAILGGLWSVLRRGGGQRGASEDEDEIEEL